MEKVFNSNLFKVLIAIAVCLFIISLSISVPILCRPLYFTHIDKLALTSSGYSKEQIIDGYNALLDYLTFRQDKFSIGAFAFSSAGVAHFNDCRLLFGIDFLVLTTSSIFIIISLILKYLHLLKTFRIGKRTSFFYGGLAAIILPIFVGPFASINFDKAFDFFHKILFPGEENWVFDVFDDPIITVLPEEFFINCAIIIGIIILVISIILMTIDIIKAKNL